MKNLLLIILFSLSFSFTTLSQVKTNKLFTGIKSGTGVGYFDMIQQYQKKNYVKSSQLNFIFGLTSNYKINKFIYFCSDLIYNFRAGGFNKINDSVLIINNSISYSSNKEVHAYFYENYRIRSLDIPIYMKIGFSKSNMFFFVNTGISPSLILKSEFVYNTWRYENINAISEWHKIENNKMDKSISIAYFGGFGIHYSSNKVLLIPEFRFTRFLNNEMVIGGTIQNSKNFIYCMSLSILF